MKAGAGLVLALAIAIPAAARGDEMKLRTTGLPASAIAAGQNSAGALDEGRLALTGNNPAQAISAFHIALAQAPQSVAALNGLAVAYDRLGRSDLARQHFEMALALEPDAADIAYNLGLALGRAGQDRNAIPHLQRAAMGNDARAAAAARRTLAQVAARLTTPPAPIVPLPAAPKLATAGSRIDLASSGEAVLVLAPAIPPPPAAPHPNPMPPAPMRLAAVEPALAARLGEAAVLTIPLAPPPQAPAEASTSAAPAPSPEPHRVASRTPAPAAPALSERLPPRRGPPEQPVPALAAILPALAQASPPRLPAIAAQSLRGWREAAFGRLLMAGRRKTPRPAPFPEQLPAQLPGDRTALIRQAIARLEVLVALIEVRHG